MMVFDQDYASAYDLVYRDKSYESECDLLERIFAAHGRPTTNRILDLGCGTGNHALTLARRGYAVVGIDRSEQMLSLARSKARDEDLDVQFEMDDIRTFVQDETFDAISSMFAVMSYQISDDDVRETLRGARRALRPGGLLVFDVWHGPAVLTVRPEARTKDIEMGDGRTLRRTSSGHLIEGEPLCSVEITVEMTRETAVLSKTSETHVMRYFFPEEVESFLHHAGFVLVSAGGFPDFESPADESTWNVLYVARASD